jgi:CRP-like cAMP-binding protein
MTMQELIQKVLGVPLFHGLKARHVMDITNAADRIIYRPGDVIAQRQTIGQASIIIVDGTAVRVNGPDMTSQLQRPEPEVIAPGSMIGELSMFIDVEHLSTVLAKSEVRALRLTQSMMHHLMENDAELADHFVSQISQQLTTMSEKMRDIDNALTQSGQLLSSGQSTTLSATAAAMRTSDQAPAPSPRLH